jgi:hypothetical protein
VTIVLDAGALVAADRGNRELTALLKRERLAGRSAITHGGVVGQVWRGGGRQANLTRVLEITNVEPLDDALGRRAGALLGDAGTSDVIDAAVVLLARDGDDIFTSDVGDLALLAEAAGLQVELVPY